MRKILFLAFVAVAMVACNKNQRTVNKIEGAWKAKTFQISSGALTIDLLSVGDNSYEIEFDKCKLKNDEFCTYTETTKNDGEQTVLKGLYRITSEGEKIEMKDDFSSTTIRTLTIEYISRSEMEAKTTTELDDGSKAEVTLTFDKQ